jgi:Dyp-type peroxidase family
MPIDLKNPLAWKKAKPDERKMLEDLQGNILKGHGRNFTYNLFLNFNVGQYDRAREFVHDIAAQMPSALSQLQASDVYKSTGESASVFTAFFLSARGYGALGRADLKPTRNADPFEAGMKPRSVMLNDPPVDTWNAPFRADIHAMLLIADDSEAVRDTRRGEILQMISETNGAVTLIGVEEGRAMRNQDEHGIEHFGYVDGRSQPLMLVEDWENERDKLGGVDQWDPKIPLGQVLVPCPGGSTPHSHGSYFVFRKLEQNVRGFKKDEQQLATFLGLGAGEADPEQAAEARELAGAMVVGRFENGQPVARQNEAGNLKGKDVPNNFNFKADPNGLKCPFAGHIRKSNPRGDSEDKLPQFVPKGSEIGHLMARRGITYGFRSVHPNDPTLRFEDMPTGDVGLLFMAYQSNLATQFEFTQQTWVNNAGFVVSGTGIDPVIGQTPGANAQKWPDAWGVSLKAEPYDFSDWVTMQGGEYFFAPCLSMLKSM